MSNDLSRRSASGARADRDRILEQALTQELRADIPPPTPACLDAETLAAWEDGGHDAAAMEFAEIHASTCLRCQSMLAAMVVGTPATVPVEESKSLFSWHWWFAPIAAAATAVTIWMVVPEQQQIATAPPSAVASGRDATSEPKALADSAPATAAAQGPSEQARNSAPDRAPTPAAKFAEREDRRERQDAPAAIKEAGKLAEAPQATTATDAVSTPAPAPPAAARPAAAESAANVAAPPAQPAPLAPPGAPSAAGLFKSAGASGAPIEIMAPDSVRRWRVVATGIEFSSDRGTSWIPVRAIGDEAITGGFSPAGSICWMIGRAGMVLVTADGMTFARVPLPVRVDVVSITATDARVAVVTTADGRAFRTDDSGRNWRQN